MKHLGALEQQQQQINHVDGDNKSVIVLSTKKKKKIWEKARNKFQAKEQQEWPVQESIICTKFNLKKQN